MSQPGVQPQLQAEPLVDAAEVQFWLGKAVAWGQAESPDNQIDTCLYLSKLKDFLKGLLTHISNMSSTTETIRRLPFVGQLLGRLCWNPYVTADAENCRLLFRSLWSLYSEEPSNAVERKANLWIRNVLCQLAMEEDHIATQALVNHTGIPPNKYHLNALRKMVALMVEKIGKSCHSLESQNQRCSCESVLVVSEMCIPLVMCPEAASLIDALLLRPMTCGKAALNQEFLDAVSSAYSRKCLLLEEQAIVSLWCHSLPSLEGAVMSLLESVLNRTGSTPCSLEQNLAQSILPKACAEHSSLFLVVNDIFRSILKQIEGNQLLWFLLQLFTRSFLRERTRLQSQSFVSLKAFFPSTPHNLLVPLLTQPTDMPMDSWTDHLTWLSGELQRLTEEEEEERGEDERSSRGQCVVFEAWFLLVQCAHWVEVAVQLLVSAEPEDCDALLWLLTFYHHPTNTGHHRAVQLVNAREAWCLISSIFHVSAPPLPADSLQSLAELLLTGSQQPRLAPLMVLSLLVNVAVFSQNPLGGVTEAVCKVVEQCGVVGEVVCILSSVELRLNGEGCSPSDAHRVQLRIKAVKDTLAAPHTEPC